MTAIHMLFYIFSATAILSGLMVVTSRSSVHSVLFLVLTFFAMAGVWLLLHAEFLALVLVLVYVGAVMTLFLFVVMMLDSEKITSLRNSFVRYLPIGALIVLLVVGLTVMVVGPDRFSLTVMPAPATKSADYNNLADLGMVLYTDYAYPFQIAGALLLAGIIAAISLTHRPPKKRKSQNVNEQIAAKPENRLRLINMPSEPKEDKS